MTERRGSQSEGQSREAKAADVSGNRGSQRDGRPRKAGAAGLTGSAARQKRELQGRRISGDIRLPYFCCGKDFACEESGYHV